jgi:integrase
MAALSKEKGGFKIRFYDGDGTRRQIRLAGMTQKQAEQITRHVGVLNAAKIVNDANLDRQTALWLQGLGQGLHDKLAAVGLVEKRVSGTVGDFIRDYIGSRLDCKRSTLIKMQTAANHLLEFFGASRELRSVDIGDADKFRSYLYRRQLSENTVRRFAGLAKQFFGQALRLKLIEENPFKDQVAAVRGNPDKFHFVTRADSAKILRACPDVQWKMIFALCRFGGLRCPSEVLSMKWEDISWAERRVTVRSPKTEHFEGKATRVIPLFPELAAVLTEGFETAMAAADAVAEGGVPSPVTGPVITRYRDTTQNLRTTFLKILARAGVKPWPKLMQNLRSSRETELAETFPIQAVVQWMGNTVSVASKHYLQLRDEHFEKATVAHEPAPPSVGPKVDPQADPQGTETGETGANSGRQSGEQTAKIRPFSPDFASFPEMRMGPTGLEPVTFRM